MECRVRVEREAWEKDGLYPLGSEVVRISLPTMTPARTE